jgi:hypothetical protein
MRTRSTAQSSSRPASSPQLLPRPACCCYVSPPALLTLTWLRSGRNVRRLARLVRRESLLRLDTGLTLSPAQRATPDCHAGGGHQWSQPARYVMRGRKRAGRRARENPSVSTLSLVSSRAGVTELHIATPSDGTFSVGFHASGLEVHGVTVDGENARRSVHPLAQLTHEQACPPPSRSTRRARAAAAGSRMAAAARQGGRATYRAKQMQLAPTCAPCSRLATRRR